MRCERRFSSDESCAMKARDSKTVLRGELHSSPAVECCYDSIEKNFLVTIVEFTSSEIEKQKLSATQRM